MRTLWRLIAGFLNGRGGTQLYSQTGTERGFPGAGAGLRRHLGPVQQHHHEHATRGALLLDITGVVVDKPSASSKLGVIGRQLFGASSDRLQENSLFDIVQTIRQAKDDRNITGIVLDLKNFAGGDQPSMQYIGKALREFRDSGKPVYAVGAATARAVLSGELRQ
jgi:protease-4